MDKSHKVTRVQKKMEVYQYKVLNFFILKYPFGWVCVQFKQKAQNKHFLILQNAENSTWLQICATDLYQGELDDRVNFSEKVCALYILVVLQIRSFFFCEMAPTHAVEVLISPRKQLSSINTHRLWDSCPVAMHRDVMC